MQSLRRNAIGVRSTSRAVDCGLHHTCCHQAAELDPTTLKIPRPVLGAVVFLHDRLDVRGGRFFWLPTKEKAMTQSELNRMVARATGENITTISGMGFVPLTPVPYEREPRTVDWDDADQQNGASLQSRRKRTPWVV